MNNKMFYTKEHEWIKIDNDIAYVGITNYAQGELGDVIFVEVPEVDDEFSQNDVFGTIEAVKTVADLYMPISCKILEINERLEDEPDIINNDAQKEGWIVKIKVLDNSQVNQLLSEEEYNKII